MKLPVVDRTHPQSSRFAMGVENKAGDSKLNDSLVILNKINLNCKLELEWCCQFRVQTFNEQ